MLLLTACQEKLQRFEYAQVHMGVRARLVLYAAEESTAIQAATAAYERVAALEQIMSDYRPDSELMQLCDQPAGKWVAVSAELFEVLSYAQKISRETDGAFDVTVGPEVALWRKARKSGALPRDEELAAARALVGWEKIELDSQRRTVRLKMPGMRLDLGGIAKGYAGDCAIAVLRGHGVRRALFEAGGDIVLGDAPPWRSGWSIDTLQPDGSMSRMQLSRCAISTSGDLEQFVVINGRRYSHVVDPRTGVGLTNKILATIIAPRGITTDSLSTVACVLGVERMRALSRKLAVTAILRTSP